MAVIVADPVGDADESPGKIRCIRQQTAEHLDPDDPVVKRTAIVFGVSIFIKFHKLCAFNYAQRVKTTVSGAIYICMDCFKAICI